MSLLDELHGVVDREQRGDVATRAVDVEADVLVGVLVLEVEHLGAHGVGHVVVDRRAQEDDVLLEHPGEQVVAPLAPVGLLEDARDVVLADDSHLSPPCHGLCLASCASAAVGQLGRGRRPAQFAGQRGPLRPVALAIASSSARSTALPSSSVTSACSTSQSKALLFFRSERTARRRPVRSTCSRKAAGVDPRLRRPCGP